jgi:hypothetical protein
MCKITTRVNVMLRDVAALGQWLLISKGYYAAVELPPAAELLAQVGGYVQGWLGMEEKLVVRDDGPDAVHGPDAGRRDHPDSAHGGTGHRRPRGDAAARSGPRSRPRPARPRRRTGRRGTSSLRRRRPPRRSRCGAVPGGEGRRRAAGLPGEAQGDRHVQDRPPHPRAASRPRRPADDVHDAEIVDDGDLEDLWFQIIAAAGGRGWTTDETEAKFAERHGGLMPATASAQQLSGFLAAVKAGEVA